MKAKPKLEQSTKEEQIREALNAPGKRRQPAMQTRNTIFTTTMPFSTRLSEYQFQLKGEIPEVWRDSYQ
jgi:hypothetical protein